MLDTTSTTTLGHRQEKQPTAATSLEEMMKSAPLLLVILLGIISFQITMLHGKTMIRIDRIIEACTATEANERAAIGE